MENKKTGETDLVEIFGGQVDIDKVDEYTYLGFVISSRGDNMANICQMRNKSAGVIRKIKNKLNSMNLKHYFFECALILTNTMLRGSILYSCEMYYNLKENELRQIERIEEGYMRIILNTSKAALSPSFILSWGNFQQDSKFRLQASVPQVHLGAN